MDAFIARIVVDGYSISFVRALALFLFLRSVPYLRS